MISSNRLSSRRSARKPVFIPAKSAAAKPTLRQFSSVTLTPDIKKKADGAVNRLIWNLGKIAVLQGLLPLWVARALGTASWEAGLVGGVAVWLTALVLSVHTRVFERVAYAAFRAAGHFTAGFAQWTQEKITAMEKDRQVPQETLKFREGRGRLMRGVHASALWLAGALTGFLGPLRGHFDVADIPADATVSRTLGLNGEDPYVGEAAKNVSRWAGNAAARFRLSERGESNLTLKLSKNDPHFFVASDRAGLIHFVRAGNPNGKKILLLPGFPEDVFCFKNIIPTLAASGADVLAIDLPGKGHSMEFPKGFDFSLPSLASVLLETLVRLDFTPDIVVGHSYGIREWNYLTLTYPAGTFSKVPQEVALFAHAPALVKAGQNLDPIKDALPSGGRFMGPFANRLGFNLPGLGVRTTVRGLIGGELPAAEADAVTEEYAKVYDRDGQFGGLFLGEQLTRALYGAGHMHFVMTTEHAAFYDALSRNHGKLSQMAQAPKVIFATNDAVVKESEGTPADYAAKLAAAYSQIVGKPVSPVPIQTDHLGVFAMGKEIAKIILD